MTQLRLSGSNVFACAISARWQPHQKPDDQCDYDIPPEFPDLIPYRLNDSGNSRRFLLMVGRDVRFCKELKSWLVWDDYRWVLDETDIVEHWAEATMTEFLHQAADVFCRPEVRRFAVQSGNRVRIRHLLDQARSDPRIAIRACDLDGPSSNFLLNCANGTFDLQTMQLRPHRRETLLTRLINIDYVPGASCPYWTAFLNDTLSPDRVAHIHKFFGYCLSSDVSQKAALIAYGVRDAGKTTMLGIVREILGNGVYSGLLQIETLTTHSRGSGAQADLADLRNRRFIQTSECGNDEALATRAIKLLTQGSLGRKKATHKYRNPVEFDETWKIAIDTNPLPVIDPDDPAAIARFHPIHFARTIPEAEIDRSLHEKLRAELPGILTWLTEGFRRYKAEGLKRPARVQADLDAWVAQCDNVPDFVEECCVRGPGLSTQAKLLFEAYKCWCEQALEKPVSSQIFARRMARQKGCKSHRSDKIRQYLGVKLADER